MPGVAPWRLSTNAHALIRSLEQPCFGVIFGKRYNAGSSGSDDCRFLDIPILPAESLVRLPPPPEPCTN